MNTNYKRQSRYPSEETKAAISRALENRKLPYSVRQKISAGMKAYWDNPNNFPADNQDKIKASDLVM